MQSVASHKVSRTQSFRTLPSCPDGFVPKWKYDAMVRSRDHILQTAIAFGIPAEALREPADIQPRWGVGRGRGKRTRRFRTAQPDIPLNATDLAAAAEYYAHYVPPDNSDEFPDAHSDCNGGRGQEPPSATS